jgi:hypothetical protein
MMLSSNAYSAFRKSGGRHRAGKRVQAKRALFMMRQQSVLDLANSVAQVTDNAFPPLSEPSSPYDHDSETSSEVDLIKAIEEMVDDVGGRVIWPADAKYKKLM